MKAGIRIGTIETMGAVDCSELGSFGVIGRFTTMSSVADCKYGVVEAANAASVLSVAAGASRVVWGKPGKRPISRFGMMTGNVRGSWFKLKLDHGWVQGCRIMDVALFWWG